MGRWVHLWNSLRNGNFSVGHAMSEQDFIAKACARETADEDASMFDEILAEVMAERESAGLAENRIQACAEAMRRLRKELKKTNQGVAK